MTRRLHQFSAKLTPTPSFGITRFAFLSNARLFEVPTFFDLFQNAFARHHTLESRNGTLQIPINVYLKRSEVLFSAGHAPRSIWSSARLFSLHQKVANNTDPKQLLSRRIPDYIEREHLVRTVQVRKVIKCPTDSRNIEAPR